MFTIDKTLFVQNAYIIEMSKSEAAHQEEKDR